MYRYEVGKPFHPTRKVWPEGCEFLFDEAGCALRLFFVDPSAQEIRDLRQGTAEFALATIENALYLLFRFGTAITWSDASYTYQRMPAERRPDLTVQFGPDARQMLTIFLVNARAGILVAMRQVTFSPEATRVLYEVVTAQVAQPYDAQTYDALIDRITRQYTTPQMLPLARVRWTAGQ